MKTVIRKLLFSVAVTILISVAAAAQDGPPPGDREPQRPRANLRRDLFRQLGLSPAQMRQIGQLNGRRRPLMEAAQHRFRLANRRLDEAIYSDHLNEVDVQDRLKEVQFSQAELIRLRSMSELSIRKILTQDQLIRFRRMRERFDTADMGPGRQERPGVEFVNHDIERNR